MLWPRRKRFEYIYLYLDIFVKRQIVLKYLTFRNGFLALSSSSSASSFLSVLSSFSGFSSLCLSSFPFSLSSSINKNPSILSSDAKQSAISCIPSVRPYTRERLFSDKRPTIVNTLNGVRRIPVKMRVMKAIRQITLSYVCCKEANVERILYIFRRIEISDL